MATLRNCLATRLNATLAGIDCQAHPAANAHQVSASQAAAQRRTEEATLAEERLRRRREHAVEVYASKRRQVDAMTGTDLLNVLLTERGVCSARALFECTLALHMCTRPLLACTRHLHPCAELPKNVVFTDALTCECARVIDLSVHVTISERSAQTVQCKGLRGAQQVSTSVR